MGNIQNFLPYSILLIVSVLSFLRKGPVENKIMCLGIFVASVIAIAWVEGFGWRLLTFFCVVAPLFDTSKRRYMDRNSGAPIHKLMCAAMGAMIVGEWVIGELMNHQPTVLLIIIAIFFVIKIFGNVNKK